MTAANVVTASLRTWALCRRLAKQDGLLAGLRVVQQTAGHGVLPVGPRGHVVVTGTLAATATRLSRGGVRSDRGQDRETVLGSWPLADPTDGSGDTLVALRIGERARPDDPPAGAADHGWATGLAWLRFGLAERLLGQCLDYLATRTTGDRRLLDLQLVRGDLGDSKLALLEIEGTLTGCPPVHVHRELTKVDRMTLRLMGASGFLADGPGLHASLSELIAGAYLDLGAG